MIGKSLSQKFHNSERNFQMHGNTKFLQNLQRFRLITFDITDTLIRFRRAPAVQYAKTAALIGVTDIDQTQLEQCFKKEFKTMTKFHPNFGSHSPNFTWQDWWTQLVGNIFRCVKPNIDQEKLQELTETLIRIYRTSECWCHIDGGQELLKKVRDAGKKIGVISNFDPSLEKVLEEMNLLDKFDFILTSYDAGYQKPHVNIYKIPLDICKVQSHEALHIGNMYDIDYVGARNAGWSSLLVTTNKMELKKVQPSHAHNSIVDLLKALHTKDIEW